MAEKKYVKGLYYNFKHEKAPEFVLGKIAIKKLDFVEWLKITPANDKGYINCDILMGKEKPYIVLNEYKKNNAVQNAKEVIGGEEVSPPGADQVPF